MIIPARILLYIREFLLHGTECCDISNKSYEDRIDEVQKVAIGHVESGFFDSRDKEAVVSQIFNYVDAVESVYMEIGMKCGAALAVQLLGGNKVQ
ncbi:hypothetical protein [Lacrimispora sphenoides]|uniref:Uncharacterized protein n=1 Tax=Lacrimispora sphenoides JCM 1415 TaxID=1297793 RepID=A0ABY1C5B8_9FIRM|nr:hypothetical protein [Lacrimispora sphenoides]SET69113.1 hypothetical protein SAMN02745906_1151 [[Clostridium] sphenoides JCM 1415]SUY50521.1 Uncharacterised protein [Lacrimispora sphenoides]